MRFQVPQFIDVEDKIFGPLTFKQFVYVAGGGGLAFLLWKTLPVFIAIILIIPIGVLAGSLAFVKVNNRPFIEVVESAFNYAFRDKLYLWKKEKPKKKSSDTPVEAKTIPSYVPKVSESKLHDISWGLDVLDSRKSD